MADFNTFSADCRAVFAPLLSRIVKLDGSASEHQAVLADFNALFQDSGVFFRAFTSADREI